MHSAERFSMAPMPCSPPSPCCALCLQHARVGVVQRLGADHPNTLQTVGNLAKLLNAGGDAAAAAALRERFGCT